MRIGVSSRLAKTALAKFGDKKLDDIEKIWHGIEAPYETLFKWLCNLGPMPEIDLKKTFRYEEKPPELKLFSIVMFGWVDITEKDL